MIFGVVRRKVNAARSKIATIVSLVVLTSLFVSIPVPAQAAACVPTSTTVSGETVLLFQLLEIANGRFRLELHLHEFWLLAAEAVVAQDLQALVGPKAAEAAQYSSSLILKLRQVHSYQ